MNILLIFSDQQHKNALGSVNPDYLTPELDKLASDGLLFTSAYSPSPVCGPFRGCLLTGKYASKCAVLENNDGIRDDDVTIAEELQEAGYETLYVGKYHLGDTGNISVRKDQRRGFERFMGCQCYNGFRPDPPYSNEVKFFDEKGREYNFNRHRTDVTADLACDMLDSVSSKFFLTVSFQAPHYPEQPSDEFVELYKDRSVSYPEGYMQTEPYTPTYSPYSPRPFSLCPDYRRYGGNMDEYLRLYAGMCSQVDRGVGKIIKKLKEKNLYDESLIIYTSDHGDMQGSRGLKNKCYPYEMSAGVPMIIRYPNAKRRGKSAELITALDFYPTFLELAGREKKTDGKSLIAYLEGKEEKIHEYVISEYLGGNAKWRMCVSRPYKLITDKDYKPTELYNTEKDRAEANNLINDEEYEPLIKQLTQNLINDTKPI